MVKTLADIAKMTEPPRPRGRPKKNTGQFEVGHTKGGRPLGVKNKAKIIATALVHGDTEKIVKALIKVGLNEEHPQQVQALKLLMERILPPVREVNIKQDTQTSIAVLVEGVQTFAREAIEHEVEAIEYEESEDAVEEG